MILSKKVKRNIQGWIWIIIRAVIIIGLCYIILSPLIMQFSSSLMTEEAIFNQTVKWIPETPNLYNYIFAFRGMDYGNAFINTMTLTLLVSLLQLLSATFIGYGFARFKSRVLTVFFAIVIFTIIVPPQSISVAQYLNFRFFNLFGLLGEEGLNLLGSHWPFIFMAVTGTGFRNGLFIFIMRQFFKGMPRDLEDAALVDGASHIKIFYKIMLPCAGPAILTVFLFSFVWQYNDVFYTARFLGGQYLSLTLSDAAQNFSQWYQEVYPGQEASGFHYSIVNNAAMLLYLAPLLLFYGFLQRYFVESIDRTGLVG